MMATSVLLGVEARLAKTDAMLLLTCVAALGVLARGYLAQSERDISWGQALILWTAIAGGILLKGPLILMVVGLAVLSLAVVDRSAPGGCGCARSSACCGCCSSCCPGSSPSSAEPATPSSRSWSGTICSARSCRAKRATARPRDTICCCSG